MIDPKSMKRKKGDKSITEVFKGTLPAIPVGNADGPSMAGWHQIQDFITCPKAFQFRHIRGITEPQSQEPDYFAVGKLMHVAKAHWFASRFDTSEETLQRVRDLVAAAAVANKLPVTLNAEQTALRYFQEYVTFWKHRPKPMPVAAEYDIGPAPLEQGDPFFLWRTGRLDDVGHYPEVGGKLCIGDMKTTGASINDCENEYRLHGQPLLYAALWKTAPQGEKKHGPIAGVVLDVVQKGYGGAACKFARVFVPTPDRAVEWFIKNLKPQLRAAAQVDWNADAPRNITSCTRMQGRARVACAFRELCMFGRSASMKYVLPGGKSLLTWKPNGEKQTPPWE